MPRKSMRSLSGFLKAAWKCVIASALQLSEDLLDAAVPYAKSLKPHIHTPWLVGVASGCLLHSLLFAIARAGRAWLGTVMEVCILCYRRVIFIQMVWSHVWPGQRHAFPAGENAVFSIILATG